MVRFFYSSTVNVSRLKSQAVHIDGGFLSARKNCVTVLLSAIMKTGFGNPLNLCPDCKNANFVAKTSIA